MSYFRCALIFSAHVLFSATIQRIEMEFGTESLHYICRSCFVLVCVGPTRRRLCATLKCYLVSKKIACCKKHSNIAADYSIGSGLKSRIRRLAILTDVTYLGRSNTGIVGSNPTWGMDVCPYLSALYCPVYVQALRRADSPSKESYQLSKKVKKSGWKCLLRDQGSQWVITLTHTRC
jgi:hypothetical protein